MKTLRIRGSEYSSFFTDIKERIQASQLRAASSLHGQLLDLYWQIGKTIVEQQESRGWGDAVLDRLSSDLKRSFPEMRGFSRSNLFGIRQFYLAYRLVGNCPTAVGQISWSHNLLLLNRVNLPEERAWYAEQTVIHGWSRRVLEHQISSGLYDRQATPLKDHNFDRTLPEPQSDLARELLKDPYHFDFLDLGSKMKERDLERALISHLQEFLLELGAGFAFIGRQYALEVAGHDYYIDLLFYHLSLRSLVAIDLKMESFRPEHAGKMNFYLSALDDRVRHGSDRPSIGILLCKEKDRTTVEYALRDTAKPIGVSAYRLTSTLPKELRGSLPTLEQFDRQLRSLT